MSTTCRITNSRRGGTDEAWFMIRCHCHACGLIGMISLTLISKPHQPLDVRPAVFTRAKLHLFRHVSGLRSSFRPHAALLRQLWHRRQRPTMAHKTQKLDVSGPSDCSSLRSGSSRIASPRLSGLCSKSLEASMAGAYTSRHLQSKGHIHNPRTAPIRYSTVPYTYGGELDRLLLRLKKTDTASNGRQSCLLPQSEW